MSLDQQRTRDLLDSMEGQGCTLKRTSKGWQIRFPNGCTAQIHLTNSDHRADKNIRSVVRRNGINWPFDGRR